MEITIETIYHMIQDMDQRLNGKIDALSKDHAQLSKSVARLEERVDGDIKSINNRFWYLNWLFAAVIVFMMGAVGKLLLFPGT